MRIRSLFLLILLGTVLSTGVGCGGAGGEALPEEVFILGVSTLDWSRIDALVARGDLPNFQRLMNEGVRCAPGGEDPLSTPSRWASLETGKSPRLHRVLAAIELLDGGERVPARSATRRSLSLWQMLSYHGLSVACVGLPASWPAETLRGEVVTNTAIPNRWTEAREVNFEFVPGALDTYPGYVRGEIESLARHPEDLDRKELARFFTLDEQSIEKAFEEPLGSIFRVENPLRDFVLTYQTDRSYLDMALMLRERYRPELTAVFLELPAVVSPAYWYFVEPSVYKSAQGQAHRYRRTVDEVYRWVDECLGRVLDALGPRSTIIVVSERGFGTSYLTVEGDQPKPYPEAQPDGVLLMRGPGLREGIELHNTTIYDFAPTVLEMLGLPAAEDMDGRPLTRAFTSSFLAAHPPFYRSTYQTEFKPDERYAVEMEGPAEEQSEDAGAEVPKP